MLWMKVGIWFVVLTSPVPTPRPAHPIEVAKPVPVDQPAPRQTTAPPSPPRHHGPINWYAIAVCESRGSDGRPRWHLDSTYDGGLQFHPKTWLAAGGGRYAPYAWQASPAEQIATAQAWVKIVGCYWCRSGWPYCGRFG